MMTLADQEKKDEMTVAELESVVETKGRTSRRIAEAELSEEQRKLEARIV